MAFWTDAKLDPSRRYRFRIQVPQKGASGLRNFNADGEDVWWWAVSVEKPSYEVDTKEYQLTNHKFKFPGVLTWRDIAIRVVDPLGDKVYSITNSLMANLGLSYNAPDESSVHKNHFSKEARGTGFDKLIIQQLNAKGGTSEEWTLHDAFIKSVNFGQLSYQEDGLVEIEIGISYDFATFESNPSNSE